MRQEYLPKKRCFGAVGGANGGYTVLIIGNVPENVILPYVVIFLRYVAHYSLSYPKRFARG
jgi:hypothetical protein